MTTTSTGTPPAALIVGGGPGGAAAATILARAGHAVLLLEREVFPRFHIGESLLPASHEALDELGVTKELAARPFVAKQGALFETDCGTERARVSFAGAPGVKRPTIFHAPRAEFDSILLNGARRAGATVIEGARVEDVQIRPGGSVVRWRDARGEHKTRARVVIDASGRAGVLAQGLGLRQPDPELRKAALHRHYTGVAPHPDGVPGDIHVVVRGDGGWAWLIPLPGGRTSVGFVFDHEESIKLPGESAEQALERWVWRTPAVAELMQRAQPASPARWEANFAYGASQVAGDGFALVGDAAGFLDPIFSSGVHMALTRGVGVGHDLARALKRPGPITARQLRRSTRAHRRRMARFRRLVLGFYDPAFRDMFFQPQRWPAGTRALVSVMAGVERPSRITRARLALFYGLVRVNRRLRLVPPPSAAWARSQPTTPRQPETARNGS